MSRQLFTFYFGQPSSDGCDRTYFPKDFTEDMERYADSEGHPCPEVHSSHLHPDYSVLSPEQFDYYLWWRTNIRAGKAILADSGYAWLYACELINSKDDPKEVLKRITAFVDAVGNSLRMASLIRNLPLDYVIAHDLSPLLLNGEHIPAFSRWYDTWAVTHYPMVKPSYGLAMPEDVYGWYKTGVSEEDLYEVVCMSLAGIDEITRSSQSRSLISSLDCDVEFETYTPFQGFADFTGTKPRRLAKVSSSEGPLLELIDGIIRTACKYMRTDGKSTNIPKSFPQDYRRVVAAAVDAVVQNDPYDARTFRVDTSEDGGFWEDDVLEPFEEEETPTRPTLHRLHSPIYNRPPYKIRTLMSNWALESEVPVEYVTSDHTRAYYDEMDESQKAYYIYWRTMARKGEILDADEGYLSLYIVELINLDEDPEWVQERLDEVLEAFFDGYSSPATAIVAARDHAILHDFEPTPIASTGHITRYTLYRKLSSEPIGDLTVNMVGHLAGYDPDKYTSDDPIAYGQALTQATRALDSYMLDKKGKRIYENAGTKVHTSSEYLYSGIWTPKNVVKKVEFIDVYGSKRVTSIMDGVLKYTIRTMRKHIGKSYPRMPTDFKDEYADVVVSAVEGYLKGIEDEAARRKAERQGSAIKIDRKAVETATKDLEAVREMMAVEDEEATTVEPVVMEQEATGWSAFIASLDEVESAYLRALLSGEDPSSALKETKRRPSSVEDSINTKSMDAVGDAIMEDGVLFDDYIKDITEVL